MKYKVKLTGDQLNNLQELITSEIEFIEKSDVANKEDALIKLNELNNILDKSWLQDKYK